MSAVTISGITTGSEEWSMAGGNYV